MLSMEEEWERITPFGLTRKVYDIWSIVISLLLAIIISISISGCQCGKKKDTNTSTEQTEKTTIITKH